LTVTKPNSVHRQTVQTAWCEEDILDHVSYLQASCLMESTGSGIKCGVMWQMSSWALSLTNWQDSLLFPLAAPYTRCTSHQFCQTESTQNLYSCSQMHNKWTKSYCSLYTSVCCAHYG